MGQEGRGGSRQKARVAKDDVKMAIQDAIDRLERLIAQGSRLPLVGKVMVPGQEVLAVLDELRLAVPEEVIEAGRILKERDHLLGEAQRESARLLADSQAALEARLRDTEMVKRAEERSREVLKKAQGETQALREEAEVQIRSARVGADQYVLEVLHKLDVQLASFQNAVRKGIEVLERGNAKVADGS